MADLCSSRRNFLRSAVLSAGAAALYDVMSESTLAYAQRPKLAPFSPNAVLINANENPMGPCEHARAAMTDAVANSGRYREELTEEFINVFAQQNGLKPEYVMAYPGSSAPLHYTVLAFTSPEKPLVTADPGYEAGEFAAKVAGAKAIRVPLTADYAHDMKGMVAASQNTGVIYICNPNNPTGTVTKRADIEWALANKPAGSVLLVDEAYIHFSDVPSVIDLVAADKDVVVLRTFSKIYGMAGLRCGVVAARPDLLQKLGAFGGWTLMPATAIVAATCSLQDPELVPQRKKAIGETRSRTFEWLTANHYAFTPSQSNCFMVETHHPAKDVIAAMQAKNVYVGRPWPSWPTHVRVTVGSPADMQAFQKAFTEVMSSKTLARVEPLPRPHFASPMLPDRYREA